MAEFGVSELAVASAVTPFSILSGLQVPVNIQPVFANSIPFVSVVEGVDIFRRPIFFRQVLHLGRIR